MILCRGLTIILMILAISTSFAQQSSLDVVVTNIQKGKGKVVVAIYDNPSDWLETPFRETLLSTDEESNTASFDVPPGNYALSIFQDTNENGELDTRIFGIPKEPIGFGNNYKPFGKPDFKSALIEYGPATKPQEIKLVEIL